MKNYFIFRETNIKDLKDILRLNFELFKKEYREFDKSLNLNWTYGEGKKYFRNRIVKKDGFVEVIENKEEIIGYLCGGITKKPPYCKRAGYAELENMLIKKKFRGMGLGTKLTIDFIDWCKKNKIDYILVKSSVQNKPAHEFYRKFRFKDYDLILELKITKKI